MLKEIQGLRGGVVGIEASGKVTGDDYETVLIPAVERALQTHDTVHLLYVLGQAYEGFSAAALWDDAKVGLKHLRHFGRVAVVSDDRVVTGATKAIGFFLPCEVRLFDNSERAAAEVWITG